MTFGPGRLAGWSTPIRRLAARVLRAEGAIHAFLQTLATQVLVLAINLATGIITARLLGPHGRGVFTAITFWPQFMATLFQLGLPSAVMVHMKKAGAARGQVVTAGLLLGAMLGVAAALASLIAVPLAMRSHYPEAVVRFTIMMTVLGAGLSLLTILLRQVFVMNDRVGAANRSTWANPLLYFALLVALALTPWLDARTAALCQLIAGIVTLVWLLRDARGMLHLARPPRGQVREIAGYAARLAPGEALATAATSLDRVVLLPLVTPSALGIYAVAYSLSRLLMIVQVALASVVLPTLARAPAAEVKAMHDRILRLTLVAVVLVSLGAILLGRFAIVLLYGPDFAEAGPILMILIVEAGIACCSFVVVQLFLLSSNPGYVSYVQLASFFVAGASLLVLVPLLGAIGAAVALLIAAVVRFLVLAAGVRWRLGMPLPNLRFRKDDFTPVLRAVGL